MADITLVVGGTGNVGQGLVPGLLGAGQSVRVLTRDPDGEVAQRHADAGAEVVRGDLDDAASLDAALAGVDKVALITTPSPHQLDHAGAAIEATKRTAPNARLVRMSARTPEPMDSTELGRHHAQIEDAVRDSGLNWTIVRPIFFMQNLIGAAGGVVSDGNLYQPFKNGVLPMIDVRDVAESLVTVLTTEGHAGKVHELTGPEAIGMDRVAEALTKATGNKITYVDVSIEAAEQSFVEAGFPKWIAHAFCELFEGFANNGWTTVTKGVDELTGHAPRTVDDFAADFGSFFQG